MVARRNRKPMIVLPSAREREAAYRARNPRLAPRPFKLRARTVRPLTGEQREANYTAQNLAAGRSQLTVPQRRQLRRKHQRPEVD